MMTDDKSITLPPLPPHRLGERWPHHVVWGYEDMVTFARAAVLLDRQQRAADVREQCAKVCESLAADFRAHDDGSTSKLGAFTGHLTAQSCADAIRARTTPAPSAEPVDDGPDAKRFTAKQLHAIKLRGYQDAEAVMRQALEAIEERYIGALRDNAIDALRAALEGKP
jgi:hypothetical protein